VCVCPCLAFEFWLDRHVMHTPSSGPNSPVVLLWPGCLMQLWFTLQWTTVFVPLVCRDTETQKDEREWWQVRCKQICNASVNGLDVCLSMRISLLEDRWVNLASTRTQTVEKLLMWGYIGRVRSQRLEFFLFSKKKCVDTWGGRCSSLSKGVEPGI